MESDVATHQQDQAAELLAMIGRWLNQADRTLDNLEDQPDLLGLAIIRKCEEFADVIAHLAAELEQQSPEHRRRLVDACFQDARDWQQQQSQLSQSLLSSEDEEQPLANVSEGDLLQALAGATTLLRDVEAAFRDIGRQEADDLADATLTLARLFLLSLQSIHSTLTPEGLVQAASRIGNAETSRSGVEIELLPDGDEVVDSSESHFPPAKAKHEQNRRLRVLWPPLGPAVSSALQWGQETATKQPVLAVALGLTLWPAAIGTAIFAGSLVLFDGVVQDIYSKFQNGPIISNLEQGAAQLVQVGKVTFLCSKLVGKQTLKVASRQVERHGGVGHIASNVGSMAVDRVMHPIETVGMAWNGISGGMGLVATTVHQLVEQYQEQQRIMQGLQ